MNVRLETRAGALVAKIALPGVAVPTDIDTVIYGGAVYRLRHGDQRPPVYRETDSMIVSSGAGDGGGLASENPTA